VTAARPDGGAGGFGRSQLPTALRVDAGASLGGGCGTGGQRGRRAVLA